MILRTRGKSRSKFTLEIYITNWSYSNRVDFFGYVTEDEIKEDILGCNPSNTTHCCSKISSEILQDVLLGITLLRCDYMINLTQEDACIKEDLVCVQFSLRLTQQHFEFKKSRKEEVKERQIF